MDPIYERTRAVTVRPAHPGDAESIRAIRNHAIEHSTALWTQTPQSPTEGAAWLATHLERGSAFVADVDGEVAGFAVYGPWRELDGYRHTVEDSVYVREGRHGLGIGFALLASLITAARDAGHHVVIAGIEAENTSSIRLHERFGFHHVGTVPEVGTKFGRWLDLTIMRLPLT
ncbi:GNAT family N-acetyltransferase [Streptomyces diastatochromogenes]|uniref:GNAT family N-acetyltransferase n=1 Tax=Streptomyces diastatochromogenes TaxID=42236 RepID=A0A233RZ35_STRDA|nr:GNAT family N-acetyltransferase [Streptomyces diastatochromogenes]MCZ0991301.1 GNAT family N-acetyltransferase [Streptomyces diastatochromogenes]OXY88649.1 GNAT family N-acetyltransferase [Streptomyces diastatochromogenes]